MARTRKTWRFRTGDTTMVEVSAAPDATRTQIRRRGRSTLVVGMLMAILAVGAVMASADTVTPDGDTVAADNQSTVNLGTVAPGAVLTPTTRFTLTCTGKNHPDQGQTLGLVFSSGQSTIPAGSLSATNGSIGPIPAGWPDDTSGGGSTNCPSPDPTLSSGGAGTDSTVTITAPTTPGTYSYVVWWNFGLSPAGNSDANAVIGNNASVTYTLTVASPDVAPVIAWTANPSTATTGDTKTYSFSIADSDSSSWSFASGYPDCGSGSLGSSSIDNGTKTGTFQCTFASAGSPTVGVKVSDGSKDGNLLTQAVTVSPPPDTTPPDGASISIDSSATWTNSTGVTLDLTAHDAVGVTGYRLAETSAGLDTATTVPVTSAVNFSASSVAFTLGSGDASSKSVYVRFFDQAGNHSDASDTIGLDTVKPKITGSTGSYTPGTWTNQSVTVSFTCADDQGTANSGIASNTVTGDTRAGSGEDQSVTNTGTCIDQAGNAADAVTVSNIDIDKIKPVISVDTGTYTPGTWTNQSVNVSFSCADSGSPQSGIQTDTVGGGGLIATESATTAGTNVASTGTCVDNAGNSADAASVTVKIDKTNPSVSVLGFTNGQTFTLGQTLPTPSCSQSDALSGIDASGNTGPTITADTRDANGIGSVTYTCGAKDNAGNTNSASSTFAVGYAVCLLYDPSKSNKAGSVAPLKFFLCDGSGADLSSSGVVVQAATLVKKDSNASPVIDDAGASNSPDYNFRYDSTLGPNGGYIFNLSTKQPPLGSKSALTTGTYILSFRVDGTSNAAYTLQFDVK